MKCLILFASLALCLTTASSINFEYEIPPKVDLPTNATTKLEDVNNDCLLLIDAQLPVLDLFSMEKMNDRFRILAVDELRRRFSRKLVIIKDFAIDASVNPLLNEIHESFDCINMFKASLIRRVLREFGSSIQSLQIDFHTMGLLLDPPNLRILFQLIAEHCSISLRQLHLGWVMQNVFNNMKTVFKNVEIVSLEGRFYDLGIDNFNVLFPKLRELILDELVILWSPNCLNLNIPHLQHLDMSIDEGDAAQLFTTQRLFSEIIGKNAQIQSLVMRQVSAHLLKIASVKLTQLKHLEIYDYRGRSNDMRNIHFERVKSFITSHDVPIDVTFGNDLIEFEINEVIPNNNKYIDFVKNNKNLKRIQINSIYGLTDKEISRLSTIESNAENVSVVCDKDVKHENIIKLIRNFRNLKQFHLKMIAGPYEMNQMLLMIEKQFKNDFLVRIVGFEAFLEQK